MFFNTESFEYIKVVTMVSNVFNNKIKKSLGSSISNFV